MKAHEIFRTQKRRSNDKDYEKVMNETYEVAEHTIDQTKNSRLPRVSSGSHSFESKSKIMVFIRAPLKVRPPETRAFITTHQNGAAISSWCEAPIQHPIPSGCPGRVGEIIDKINQGVGSINHSTSKWTPPISYEFIASTMPDRDAYIKRCDEWFEQHLPRVLKVSEPPVEYNKEFIAKYYKGLTSVPDESELLTMWRAAGISEEQIQKFIDKRQKMAERAAEDMVQFEAIFGPLEEPKKVKKVVKVIKAVKKRT